MTWKSEDRDQEGVSSKGCCEDNLSFEKGGYGGGLSKVRQLIDKSDLL